jgi:PAS domain S-box-containing protein
MTDKRKHSPAPLPSALDERDLEKFPEENPYPVLRVAKEGNLLYANQASAALLESWRCTEGQLLPQPWPQHILTVLSIGAPAEKEMTVGERVFSLFLAPLVENGYVNIYGYDITERRRIREGLTYQANLLANVHDAVIAVDKNLKVTYWNQAAAEMFGWSEDEALGRETTSLYKVQIPNSTREETLQQLIEEGYYEGELLYIRKDDLHIEGHVRSTALNNAEGEFSGLVTIIRDVTESNRAQQQKMELILERERMHLLTSFIQNAAHEFRTPLAVINTVAFVMAQITEAEKLQAKQAVIQEQVHRIAKLVDMLLLMSKLESGITLENSLIDIGEIVETARQKANSQYAQHLPLHCEIQSPLPLIQGDFDLFLQAFWQVLDNAYRFTLVDGTITVSASADEQQIYLVVEDTGPGIPSEEMSNIFKTFWRQDQAHTLSGFGLGLPIAQKIVARYKGRIEVQSEVGKGTTVTITIPIPDPKSMVGM